MCIKISLAISLTLEKSLASFFDSIEGNEKKLIILNNSVMKQVLLFIAIAAVVSVAAVSLNNSAQKKKMDTIELAQLRAWKDSTAQEQNYIAPKVVTKQATKSATVKRTTISYQSPKMVSETKNAAKVKKG